MTIIFETVPLPRNQNETKQNKKPSQCGDVKDEISLTQVKSHELQCTLKLRMQ